MSLRLVVLALLTVAILLTFILPSALSVAPSFSDVPVSHPYHDAILDLAERGIISGYGNGTFGPGDLVMRQQFAKMIVLAAGYPVSSSDVCPFGDVEQSTPPALYPDHYVAVAATHRITLGKTATSFAPFANISRLQVISMVVRAAALLAPGMISDPPVAWSGAPGWGNDPTHGDNARKAEYNGLLLQLPLSSLDPRGAMPRGEVAQVLHNLLTKLGPTTTTGGPTTTAGGPTTSSATTTTTTTTTTSSSTTTSSTTTSSTTTSSTTTTSSATTTSSTTTTTLPGSADLVHFWLMPGADWQAENISQLTGEHVAGPATAYELSEFDPIEHLATVSPAHDLLVFSETPLTHNWQVVNVSQKTGEKISGAITSWRTGTSTATTADDADHLAAMSPSGDLLHFWSTPQSDWLVENVSAMAGGAKIASPPTSWHAIPNASDVDHLAAMAPNGDLILFWGAPLGHNWQLVNVSQISGQKIAGPPIYWLYVNQSGAWADNLAAVGVNGELMHFRWNLQADWVANPLVPSSGYTVTGSLACWSVMQSGLVVHLGVMSTQGDLLHYWTGPSGWQVENISQLAGGVKIAGSPTDWSTGWTQSGATWVDRLAAADPLKSLLVFRAAQPGWQAVNLTEKTGVKIRQSVTGWITGGLSANTVDHLAAMKSE